MVCDRCILVVRAHLTALGVGVENIKLGEVELERELTSEEINRLEKEFLEIGFELIDDKRTRLIELVKTNIIESIYAEAPLTINLSDYLSDQLHMDYTYLSNLFSEIEGTTIEKFYIQQKIERVKELLVYDELTLSQIANQLNYSSSAHLSTQFKKTTGFTPSQYKQKEEKNRKPLDKL